MSVVYDLRGFQSRLNSERGIARYVLQLALALERTDPALVTQYLMHPGLPFPPGAEALVSAGKVARADRDDPVRAPSADGVFVAPSPFEDFNCPSEIVFPRWARTPGWRTVGVLHDLIPLRFPEWYLADDADRRYYHTRLGAVANLDHLLSVSEASARDAVELLGFDARRITAVGAGADPCFQPSGLPRVDVAAQLAATGDVAGLRPGYVLYPAGPDPRKNLERTVLAYGKLPERLRRRHQLVLACRLDEGGQSKLSDVAARAGVSAELLTTGYVSDEVLCRLYQGAHLVIFPSLYEGFGLPVIEAMACGAPVICADSSSLVELQTMAEARFDPSSVDAIAAALRRAVGDEFLLERLRNQPLPPFSWDNAARLAAVTIGGLLERRERIELPAGPGCYRPRAPRLAVVGPLPPQRCAAASYVFRLLDELRHHCDVTAFVGTDAEAVEAPAGVAVEPVRRLELIARCGGAFDRLCHVIGPGEPHVAAFEALQRLGGWVLLHDVRLAGLYGQLHRHARHRLAGGTVGRTVASLYPGRYRPSIEDMDVIDPEVADRFGVLLLAEVMERAERVLVHSGYEAALVDLDTGTEALAVYPYPCPAVPDMEQGSGLGPVISTFGPLGAPVTTQALFRAVAEARRPYPATRLRLVGLHGAASREMVAELAARVGVSSAVELLEPVGRQGYVMAALGATLAVQPQPQPQATTASSAMVADLLACGVPTIVADVGPARELPDDAVVKVGGGEDLARAVAALLGDDDRRLALSQAARDHAKVNSYASAAQALADALFG